LLARAGVGAGVAIAAAVLIDELVSLDDRTQELLSIGSTRKRKRRVPGGAHEFTPGRRWPS
jgi:hypothetical protein